LESKEEEMSEDKTTERWTLEPCAIRANANDIRKDGEWMGVIFFRDAGAELVRAVNTHERLVEALKDTMGKSEHDIYCASLVSIRNGLPRAECSCRWPIHKALIAEAGRER